MGSMFAFVGSADDYTSKTLDEIHQIAGNTVVLVFDFANGKVGTIYEGDVYYIASGANAGCYALVSEKFVPGNYVQLPGIKDASDGMKADWTVTTAVANVDIGTGRAFASGSLYQISPDFTGNQINLRATETPQETTSTFTKIMAIFYKVIKVLFGDALAQRFLGIFSEFGLDLDD